MPPGRFELARPKTVASHWNLLLCLIMAAVKTSEAVYVRYKIEVRSRNHCCCGTEISIKYSECMFVALVIQYSKRLSNIMICGLSGFAIFFTHYLINGTIVVIFFTTFLEEVSEMLS